MDSGKYILLSISIALEEESQSRNRKQGNPRGKSKIQKKTDIKIIKYTFKLFVIRRLARYGHNTVTTALKKIYRQKNMSPPQNQAKQIVLVVPF